ncbi:MAG TPA: hypothetical protein VMT62_06335 [Syntrophorhabdaceae bacterium]|nr:hypothetical protein [Syntrophorhabdaceae bacterium]
MMLSYQPYYVNRNPRGDVADVLELSVRLNPEHTIEQPASWQILSLLSVAPLPPLTVDRGHGIAAPA